MQNLHAFAQASADLLQHPVPDGAHLPAQALKDGSLQARVLQQLGTLVLDEADLLLSYGYEDDLRQLEPLVRPGPGADMAVAQGAG